MPAPTARKTQEVAHDAPVEQSPEMELDLDAAAQILAATEPVTFQQTLSSTSEQSLITSPSNSSQQQQQQQSLPLPQTPSRDGMVLDEDVDGRPRFQPSTDIITSVSSPLGVGTSPITPMYRVETRQVRIPPHRLTPLKSNWNRIYPPLVDHLKIQVRFNMKRKAVELRSSKMTVDAGALQKAEDFVKAFALGFDIEDAVALLRLDDLYIETFEIKDVKTLQGDHLSRAIGRIAGKDGKTKFAIENATRTRIVLADAKVHILGAYKPTQIAKASVCALILGKQPGKVYNNLRGVAARMKERF